MPTETWERVTTGDGSPTLICHRPEAGRTASEPMHSFKGALAESLYVYGEAIRACPIPAPVILSVGQGLGYLETIALALKPLARVISYENQDELAQAFRESLGPSPTSLALVMAEARSAVARELGPGLDALTRHIQAALKSGQLRQAGPLSLEGLQPADVLLYDAYCAQFDGGLWEESFLASVLDKARPGVVASYAATSALKRGLLARGYQLRKRPGFGGKRECTLGTLPGPL